MSRDVAVVVLARAPLPGRTKSRLAGRLGEWGAARLQARLTRRTLAVACRAACGPVELHGTPRARHPFFVRCARQFGVRLRPQRGGDLGARMRFALAGATRGRRGAILVGTDCPDLGPGDLRRAARLLRAGYRAVLAPTEDGGYALVGVRTAQARLFEGIDWGGDEVYRASVRRLQALGGRWRALRATWDVDRPADLERIRWRPPIS